MNTSNLLMMAVGLGAFNFFALAIATTLNPRLKKLSIAAAFSFVIAMLGAVVFL